ncbi:helix-turn-helix domain-containing protein [Lentzea flaviverrucosa]|uniref:Uncharacterized protein n=1 Tax=Lentzea flaviverrucosa TaxID=200379 RepID=A0A1H9XSI8_9PSEU|nr:helix-turn-helix domain-containing protein [Lentzea flaviverrucosa]RDI19298.1 hypothetical protein DFR72_117140 [Lentzea flaviverrucosa]SES49122.1 hypothetical protein SAMN05216195_11778 [Lentzea flaviverrucosa]
MEILVLWHQITVLERHWAKLELRFSPVDRAFLAALLHRLPAKVLRQFTLPARPETVLRWHRDLLARRHAARSRPKRPGRPRTVRSIRLLVLRLARANPTWGYRRIHGELLVLGIKIAASTVWQILKDAGIDPAPDRTSTTWADFLHSQAEALLACGFFEVATLSGTRLYVLAVIEHSSRRIRVLGRHGAPDRPAVHRAEGRGRPRYRAITDHQGSVIGLVVTFGNLAAEYDYSLQSGHGDSRRRGRETVPVHRGPPAPAEPAH